MTTVACNKDSMAADSQFTSGTLITHSRKIHKIKEDIVAYAGSQQSGVAFIDWLNGGDKPDVPLDDFEAIVLTKSGMMLYYGEQLKVTSVTEPFIAIGSGSHIAIGSMMEGATPNKAVRNACKMDAYSSGPIKVFNRKIVKKGK